MHCKDISVREVGFELDAEHISEAMRSWKAYRRAEYVVLRHGGDHAVVRLEKESDGGLFGKVSSAEIVSLPGDTVFVERPETDVLNIPAMALVQREFPGKAVVVRGMFSHVSFAKGLEGLTLRVLDLVPPRPSKLSYMVKLALASGYIEKPVIADIRETNIEDLARGAATEEVMFPCEASGAEFEGPHCFLDRTPDISGRDITLVGCRLSRRIFCDVYGRDVPFIDFCIRDSVEDTGVKTLVRCCRVRSGHEIEGNIAYVPWGVTVPEIVDAVNALFGDVPDLR